MGDPWPPPPLHSLGHPGAQRGLTYFECHPGRVPGHDHAPVHGRGRKPAPHQPHHSSHSMSHPGRARQAPTWSLVARLGWGGPQAQARRWQAQTLWGEGELVRPEADPHAQALHSRWCIPLISPRLAGVCRGSGVGRVGRETSFSLDTSGFMSICSGTHLCLFPGGHQRHIRKT